MPETLLQVAPKNQKFSGQDARKFSAIPQDTRQILTQIIKWPKLLHQKYLLSEHCSISILEPLGVCVKIVYVFSILLKNPANTTSLLLSRSVSKLFFGFWHANNSHTLLIVGNHSYTKACLQVPARGSCLSYSQHFEFTILTYLGTRSACKGVV